MSEFGQEKGWCPYFLARHVINRANILIYNYQYVLDPKVRTTGRRVTVWSCRVNVFRRARWTCCKTWWGGMGALSDVFANSMSGGWVGVEGARVGEHCCVR
jgi:hypothetical protein